MATRAELLKKRIQLSRVGIAYAVLRGYQVMYRTTVRNGSVELAGRHRVRECKIIRDGNGTVGGGIVIDMIKGK